MAKILVADDEHAICEAFEDILASAGHQTIVASNAAEAIAAAAAEQPDAIFLDVRLPDMSGLQALQQITAANPDIPVVIMTAHGTMQTAMDAVKGGAFDYLGKPLDLTQIRNVLARALHQPQAPASQAAPTTGREELVGTSAVMQEIFKMMSLLAGNDLTVLITGESGVGKELVARGIHANSQRAQGPLVAVNCAAIPEQLLESELFGHEKGAFSGAHVQRKGRFEAAAGGTLFLDEVFELPLHLQGKLLRALQERTFERIGSVTPLPLEARIIAASNRPLSSVGTSVRDDLFYRLSSVHLNIPSLRERAEDIADLARHFLAQANAELGTQIVSLEDSALQLLESHFWPGNVRELDHTIKRSVLIARGTTLAAHDLVFDAAKSSANTANSTNPLSAAVTAALQAQIELADNADEPSPGSAFHTVVTQVEQALITQALKLTQGNQVAAAQLLGINRSTLRHKMQPD